MCRWFRIDFVFSWNWKTSVLWMSSWNHSIAYSEYKMKTHLYSMVSFLLCRQEDFLIEAVDRETWTLENSLFGENATGHMASIATVSEQGSATGLETCVWFVLSCWSPEMSIYEFLLKVFSVLIFWILTSLDILLHPLLFGDCISLIYANCRRDLSADSCSAVIIDPSPFKDTFLSRIRAVA